MLGILKQLLYWQPDIDQFTRPLRTSTPFKLRIGRFSKGVDNVHIDVVLSPRFVRHAKLLVRNSLQRDLSNRLWGDTAAPQDVKNLHILRESYVGMMEPAVDRARRSGQSELIQLLQFAVVKYLLQLVGWELDRIRTELEQERGRFADQSTSRSVQLHERMVLFAKEEASLRYGITSKLFRELRKLEDMRLSKLRKSVLGRAWSVPRQQLFNPLLQLPSLWADEQFMQHYSLACIDKQKTGRFDHINRRVVELFQDYLPSWVQPPSVHTGGGDNPTTALRQRRDQGVLHGFLELEVMLGHSLREQEYQRQLVSWLDVPGNIERILLATRPPLTLRLDPEVKPGRTPWPERRWPEYHKRLLKRIFCEFRSSGLEREVLACSKAPAVYRELKGRVPVRLICDYLAGSVNRQTMLRRLSGLSTQPDPGLAIRTLDLSLRSVSGTPASRRRWMILRFICDFLVLRRDLKLAYQTHWAMNRIRLLSREQDIALSRENGTLHDFLLRSELAPVQRRIRDHVILKADLRGSTTMTRQLRKRNLNPASYFSLNFFQPITKLLPDWGAKKVFVEGDAVILSLLEYEDTPYQWLCVAHACGLARKIIQLMEVQNARNRQHGLPELELGLGIAFCAQAPTYLYDEDREIMISPAINQADKLSSCARGLRNSSLGEQQDQVVQVVSIGDPGQPGIESEDGLLRYNVNGIELDASAFQKLSIELALRPAAKDLAGGIDNSRYHIGRYPDLRGKMHWLVVREAPVRLWADSRLGDSDWRGRRFYQVVSDSELISRLTGAAALHQQSPAPAVKGDPPDPPLLH